MAAVKVTGSPKADGFADDAREMYVDVWTSRASRFSTRGRKPTRRRGVAWERDRRKMVLNMKRTPRDPGTVLPILRHFNSLVVDCVRERKERSRGRWPAERGSILS